MTRTKELIVVALTLASFSIYAQDFKIVGYISQENIYSLSDHELSRLTHLDIAFINPLDDGSLVFAPYVGKGQFGLSDIAISDAVKRAHQHGVKAIVSLAGGGFWGDPYMKKRYAKLLSKEHRTDFVSKLITYAKKNNLDGIDIDIEGDAINADLGPFMCELADSCKNHELELSAAWPGRSNYADSIPDEALECLDYLNIMSYDSTGAWAPESPGQHASMMKAVDDINYWHDERNMPYKKIVLGLPFYGKRFGGAVSYVQYKDIAANGEELANKDQDGSLWYNGRNTIQEKVQLSIEKELGGIMIWEISQDSKTDLSLLSVIQKTILENNMIEEEKTVSIKQGSNLILKSETDAQLASIKQAFLFDANGHLEKAWKSRKIKIKDGVIDLKESLNNDEVMFLIIRTQGSTTYLKTKNDE